MDEHYRPFFQFLVGTGLRFGEATALTPRDFDLDGVTPSVKVTKAWKEDEDRGFYIGPPKTKKSRRTVSLAPSTVDAVRPLVEAAGDGYVFTLKRGGVIRSGALYNRAWSPALLKSGYSKTTVGFVGDAPRVHDIRHTHASWLLQAGMQIFPLSRRLGHESIVTTSDRYSHLLPDAQFEASGFAQKALEG
jgi:integrase